MKPFVTFSIERDGDRAIVTVVRISIQKDETFKREILEEYETLSRGASVSAKRSIKKFATLE